MRSDGPKRTVGLLLCGALWSFGCGSPSTPGTYFAEYVPFAQGGVGTDLILPFEPGEGTPLLGSGWAPAREDDSEPGHWICSHGAELRFFNATDGGTTLEFRAAPNHSPNAPPPLVTISVNGDAVRQVRLEPGWRDYQVSLPPHSVQLGWNWVRVGLQHAPSPTDVEADTRDTGPLSARFTQIRVRNSWNRPLWPGRPARIHLGGESDAVADAVVEMPTDSIMDVLLEPRPGQRLVGAVDVAFQHAGGPNEIWASIELTDTAGELHEVFRRSFRSRPRRRAGVAVDLDRWRGQLVQIRMRSWGKSNGIVRWHGLGLTAGEGGESSEAGAGGARSKAGADSGAGQATGADPQASPAADIQSETGRLVAVAGPNAGSRPDIFVIMLDAARADMFLDPESPPATPHVDALAAESTVFRVAWAPSSWTGQTLPALLTGQHPDTVGAEVWGSRLPEQVPTLPELLAAAGYSTVLWSQHNIYSTNPSLQRGFTDFTNVTEETLEGLFLLPRAEDLFVAERPTFALIHLLPPHAPYQPPEPFRGRHSSWYRGDFDPSSANLATLQHDPPPEQAELDEIVRYARDLYLENVEFADHLVGRLIEAIRRAERYEDSLIVLVSDHGEAFFEHGRFLHTTHLYEEFLRVPLIIKWPAFLQEFATAVHDPVTLVDLVPSLVDGLDLWREGLRFQGQSLLPMVFDGATYERDLYAYTRGRSSLSIPQPPAPVYALRSGRMKVLYSDVLGALELFDLERDPGEKNDLAREQPLRAKLLVQKALKQRHDNLALLARTGSPEVEALDAETLRRLRALGYIQ